MKGGVASVSASSIKVGVATVPVSSTKGGVASVCVSLTKGGVASFKCRSVLYWKKVRLSEI